MILILMLSTLLVAGLLCWLVAQWNVAVVKWIALLAAGH